MTKHHHGQFALPPAKADDLHDCIALSLDAFGSNPSERNLAEARSYLRRALRLIGGAA